MIERIDHLVLTVRSLEATCRFYTEVLGCERVEMAGRPTALVFGQGKISLHALGHTFEPKAAVPKPGAGDFCFITSWPITAVQQYLEDKGVAIEEGPVLRQGALGPIRSVYVRDPDGNLVEIGRYDTERAAPDRG